VSVIALFDGPAIKLSDGRKALPGATPGSGVQPAAFGCRAATPARGPWVAASWSVSGFPYPQTVRVCG